MPRSSTVVILAMKNMFALLFRLTLSQIKTLSQRYLFCSMVLCGFVYENKNIPMVETHLKFAEIIKFYCFIKF